MTQGLYPSLPHRLEFITLGPKDVPLGGGKPGSDPGPAVVSEKSPSPGAQGSAGHDVSPGWAEPTPYLLSEQDSGICAGPAEEWLPSSLSQETAQRCPAWRPTSGHPPLPRAVGVWLSVSPGGSSVPSRATGPPPASFPERRPLLPPTRTAAASVGFSGKPVWLFSSCPVMITAQQRGPHQPSTSPAGPPLPLPLCMVTCRRPRPLMLSA